MAGCPWAEVRGIWAPDDRDLCPNPTLCVFSCQGACCLQHPGCCSYRSCHLPATGGNGTLGGRCVSLLLQVSLASLPALQSDSLLPSTPDSQASLSHRLQGKSPLQLPQTRPRPYDRITVESAFDNPTYETGVSPHVSLVTLYRTQFYAPLGRYP